MAELLAKSEQDLIRRAQAVINVVEAGDAEKVGLSETVAMRTLLTESVNAC